MEVDPIQMLNELNSIDISQLTLSGFLLLVKQISGPSNKANTPTETMQQMFRLANQKLIEFSKTHQAWAVIFEVFDNAAHLSDTEIFQAVVILKNKMMFDFVALRF
jgi:hypothetical protein